MKRVLLSLALVAMASVTYATPGNNGGGNGGCGNGQQTNGCGGSAPVTNAPVAHGGTGVGVGLGVGIGVGQGGAGGQGGQGGRGGEGGNAAVIGSGNSSNLNVLGQQQGQMQGQQQGQRQTATGGMATGGQATGGQATGGQATGGTGGNSGGNVITVEGDKSDFYAASNIPKPAAASAAPVYVNPPSGDVCQRAGFGMSLQGYGGGGAISAGGSESDTCETRADAVNLKFTGAPEAVIRARQCQNPKIAQAFKDAGIDCPKSGSKVSSAPASVPPAAAVAPSQEPADPFIRRRLGLPPV